MKANKTSSFIQSLRDEYKQFPVIEGDNAAKKMVADSIKSNGLTPDDALALISGETGLSGTLDDADWKKIINTAINYDGIVGKLLEQLQKPLKGKLTNEQLFSAISTACGKNTACLRDEYRLDSYGWKKAVEELVNMAVDEEKTSNAPVVTSVETPVENKSSIKSAKKDPRCKSVTLINIKTGETRTWDSFRECEIEVFGDPKKGHGTVSQLISGKQKRLNGIWELYKEPVAMEEKPSKHAKCKSIRQVGYGKDGAKVDKIWGSLTEAAQETKINHSSISKALNGVYASAGGFRWSYVDAA